MEWNFIVIFLSIISLISLVILRIPIAYVMILLGIAGVGFVDGMDILHFQLRDLAIAQFSNYDLSVVPMFILVGIIAQNIGYGERLFKAFNKIFRTIPGGLAIATIFTAAGFGSISGSSVATTSTLSEISIREFQKFNYPPSLYSGAIAAGGTLGILIPPSIVLIVYSIIAEVNIIAMFKAAIIPFLLAIIFFIGVIVIYALKNPIQPRRIEEENISNLGALKLLLPILTLITIIISGLVFGIFTIVPAASLSALLVIIYGVFIGKLNNKNIKRIMLNTAKLSGMIYLIIFGAEVLKIFYSRVDLPQLLSNIIASSALDPLLLIFLILLIFIILGFILDSMSIILIFVPFILPPILNLDLNMDQESIKIWFGILMLIVVELGLITPPVGLNINTIAKIDLSISKNILNQRSIYHGVLPFFFIEFIRVMLILFFPSIILISHL